MLPELQLTRRRALTIGAGALGLTLPRLLRADRLAAQPARAKSVIILYLSGGPSQLDMWDLKPRAPAEVRGTFSPISTSVPGTQLCEHMPRMARWAHKYTIVRSMSHNEGDHLRAGYWVMTGGRLTRPITAFSGMERQDQPHLGSVCARFSPSHSMPGYVVVPEYISPRSVPRPGQHGGFLGAKYDPYLIASNPNRDDFDAGPIAQRTSVSFDRIRQRHGLLDQLQRRTRADWQLLSREVDDLHATALDLVTSPAAQQAFDVRQESEATRERYGRHIFGQSVLVARRLVEAGVRVVQVNFIRHDHGPGGQGYDSHSTPPNPPHLTWASQQLLPPTDAAFAGLIGDLVERGMLDETLVVMMGEFGRTPRFNPNGGRDHWPDCYSLVLAGGGITAGQVYGESDRIASTPIRDPVTPDDLLATIYQLMGINYRGTLQDLDGRPHVISSGTPVQGLIA
jgi:hypothetical protein